MKGTALVNSNVPTVAAGESDAPAPATSLVGVEWIVEALDCPSEALRDSRRMRRLCDLILCEMELRVVADALWHQFPAPGGVTGLYLLSESHLACHTYPEHGLATLNLYCCRPRARWRWEAGLREHLNARRVIVRTVQRGVAETEGGA